MSRFGSLACTASVSARLSPNSRASAPKSLFQRSRSRASRRTWNIIWLSGSVLAQRSTLPMLEHPGIHLQERDHAALRAEVAHVVRHVLRELDDGSRRHHHLAAVDGHVGRALQHEDRLLLLGVAVHHGRLPGLVAGDLRPELVGLEEHLAHALVGREGLERVQVEDLGDTRGSGNGDVLSTPSGYEWLVHEAWNPVIEHAPKDYEVVLRHAA